MPATPAGSAPSTPGCRPRGVHGAGGRTGPREAGQVSILILGFAVIALMLVLAGIDVTAAQLGRSRLLDAADSAALDAADALTDSAYTDGLQETVTISSASVQQAAAEYLAAHERPGGISSWSLAPGTGSPDGQTSVVRMTGTVDLPISRLLREVFGGSVTITVESHARATLQ